VSELKFLPYGRQWVDSEDIKAVEEVLASDWLTTGPKVEKFEELLAGETNANYAVVFNSGTAALHAAYYAGGICPGDEVITSPITFAATANAALYLGARPVFVDIDYETGNIDPSKIERAVNKKTKIIAPVDFAGRPANLAEIADITRKNDLIIVEDAAHALGACYLGQKTGSLSDMTIFSFHPVKHITTGEGGAVVTDNQDYYQRLLMFRNHGITRNHGTTADQDLTEEEREPWYYEMQVLGYNYRLTDIQCALGISQLKKLEKFVELRRRIAREYNSRLSSLADYLDLPSHSDVSNSSWHLYVIRVKSGPATRRRLFNYLRAKNIGVQVHYIPVYWHPYYSQLGYQKGICPEAEKFYGSVISLPIYPQIDISDIERVCEEIYRFFEVKYFG